MESNKFGQINVSGSGKVQAVPDIARITFSVRTSGKRTSEAVALNTAKMVELLSVLDKFNINATDRKTVGFGIFPYYDKPAAPKKGQRAKEPKLLGYQCQNGMNIRLRKIAELSDILGALTDAQADNIDFAFEVEKPEMYEDRARKLAIEDAKRKAKIYCDNTGSRLGRIAELHEARSYAYGAPANAMLTRSAAIEDVPVAAGEEDITASITVKFNIDDDTVSSDAVGPTAGTTMYMDEGQGK